jgi:hypothetical protein
MDSIAANADHRGMACCWPSTGCGVCTHSLCEHAACSLNHHIHGAVHHTAPRTRGLYCITSASKLLQIVPKPRVSGNMRGWQPQAASRSVRWRAGQLHCQPVSTHASRTVICMLEQQIQAMQCHHMHAINVSGSATELAPVKIHQPILPPCCCHAHSGRIATQQLMRVTLKGGLCQAVKTHHGPFN